MNFARDIVEAAPADRPAFLDLSDEGRREWTFGEVSDAAAALAGEFERRGVGRGDTVMTLIGNRPEWALAMLACFRIGAVVLPCTEQLRSKDLALRMQVAAPKLVFAHRRNAGTIEAAAPSCPVLYGPDPGLFVGTPAAVAELAPTDPCLMTFTSGTTGLPKAVLHGQRYLFGQMLQATDWLGAEPGDLVWCTAASGWSKSARNAFIAPWLRGAAALLHDARFDPEERLEIVRREQVDILCMAPTEYRVIANRGKIERLGSLRELTAAGEALPADVVDRWFAATGLWIRDGYGQTETGQITGSRPGEPVRPGSMGRPLPGVRTWIEDGELIVDPETVPTFFLGYLGEDPTPRSGAWRTGDRVREDEDGFLYFEARTDDVIISSGYRIGPTEVESVLVKHPAVADVAVVGAPDQERGSVVKAFVVLADGAENGPAMVDDLQAFAREQTAPYKYPRQVQFVDELPRTTSGKVRRAALREPSP